MYNLYEISFKNHNSALCGVRVFAESFASAKKYYNLYLAKDSKEFISVKIINNDNTVFKVINMKSNILN
jgi:hypothetical protein